MKKLLKMARAIGGLVAMTASLASVSACAQGSVTDPAAPVAVVVYQSVFKESPTGVETQSVDWKKANADVAQFPRGHVDILKWEEAQIKSKSMGNSMVKPLATKGETTPVGLASTSPGALAAPPAPATPAPPATVHKH